MKLLEKKKKKKLFLNTAPLFLYLRIVHSLIFKKLAACTLELKSFSLPVNTRLTFIILSNLYPVIFNVIIHKGVTYKASFTKFRFEYKKGK